MRALYWLMLAVPLAAGCGGCESDRAPTPSIEDMGNPTALAAAQNWQGLLRVSLGKNSGANQLKATTLLWETHLETTTKYFGAQLGDVTKPFEGPPKWVKNLKDERPTVHETLMSKTHAALNERFIETCPDMQAAATAGTLANARWLRKLNDRASLLNVPAKGGALRPALKRLFEAEAEVERLKGPLIKPQPKISTKPKYSKPAYSGSYYLSGKYKGPFSGSGWSGILISRGDALYVIKGAAKPLGFTDRLNGYVEPSSPSMISVVGVGRRERQANLVELVDKLDFKDDKAKYRSEVARAKKDHQTRSAEYSQSQRKYKTALAKWKKEKAGRGRYLKVARDNLDSAANMVRAQSLELCSAEAP